MEVAIKNFQSFTGLPVTGDLDAATIKQTRAPRCGMPDDVNSEGRVKRYSTDSKWSKKRLRYFVRYAHKYGADLLKSTQAKVFRKALKYWSDALQTKMWHYDLGKFSVKLPCHIEKF